MVILVRLRFKMRKTISQWELAASLTIGVPSAFFEDNRKNSPPRTDLVLGNRII